MEVFGNKEKSPKDILRDAREHIEFAGLYRKKFSELSKKYPADRAHELSSEYGMNPEDVQRDLLKLVKDNLLILTSNPDIRDFMRAQAMEEITAILEGTDGGSYKKPPRERALLRAQKYEELGILNLDEDAELFEGLTR